MCMYSSSILFIFYHQTTSILQRPSIRNQDQWPPRKSRGLMWYAQTSNNLINLILAYRFSKKSFFDGMNVAIICHIPKCFKEFLKLENNFPPCGLCLFGRQHRRPKKAKFGSPIRQEEHNYPGGGVLPTKLFQHSLV